MKKMQPRKQKTVFVVLGDILLLVFLAFAMILLSASLWLSDVFPHLVLDELVFHLRTSISGASREMVLYYIRNYGLPVLILAAVAIFMLVRSRRAGRPLYRWRRHIRVGMAVVAVASILAAILYDDYRLGVISYLRAQLQDDPSLDDFIEENYVDPAAVELRFPAKKRNLIYIYLESMETTFSDVKSGGAFEENCIPELTELALENECFNDGGSELNGAASLSGTVWTTGAVFAQSAGLPLKISVDRNDMNTLDHFFPSVVALGNLLEDAGYTNVFLQGSDVEFGGKKNFFSDHGAFQLLDYCYARDHNWIPPQYKVWWGYEDEKLFSFAKAQLKELAGRDAPFNLTMLTVDTHFEDGYVCDLCGSEFGENQYANVFACSSRQVTEFVRWVQKQDFYENTTIVLAGDHPTMDADFCDDVPSDYRRNVYVSVINAAPPQRSGTGARSYSTFDLFPTTLAAMGVSIEGDRLGLGSNLYSDTQTLVERFGVAECNRRLEARSRFMESLNHSSHSTILTDKLASFISDLTGISMYEEGDGTVSVYALTKYDCSLIRDVDHIELEYWDLSNPSADHHYAAMNWSDEQFGDYAELIVDDIDYSDLAAAVQIIKTDNSCVRIYEALCAENFVHYLSSLKQSDCLMFLAVCDNAAFRYYNSDFKLLNQLGANLNLYGHMNASYVLIADTSGKRTGPIYEALSDTEAIEVSGQVDGVDYSVRSSGDSSDGIASIIINGEEYAVNAQGLNIVVFDSEQKEVVDSICFNTFMSGHPAMRKR